jgi:glucokinase
MFRSMSKLALGIDMGGTGIKLGLVDVRGKLLKTIRLPTPRETNPKMMVHHIAMQAKVLLASLGRSKVCGVGIGCAGDVDPIRGVIRISPNLDWTAVPLKSLIARHLKYPILLDNDANVAAWAAYIVEAKRRVNNLICITVGTGIGGGLVIDGKLYHGATGSAGEIGHMTLYPEGVPCNCGNRGCLERYIGAKAMTQEAKTAIEAGHKTILRKWIREGGSKLTPLLIQQAARAKDPLAIQLWEQAGERLGVALASTVNLLNPEWIVIAGGLSRSGPLLLAPLRRTIRNRSFPTPAKAVKIVVSKLDQDLGMVGAGLLAHERFG